MRIKEVQPITFLYFRTETSLANLEEFLPVGQALFREAVAQGVAITGPVHWHYYDFAGDASKPFTLEVALPVAQVPEAYDGAFHFKRTQPFKCVTTTHEGSWQTIPTAYERLVKYITENKLQPNAINREIYVNADFTTPEANVTEIQMGVL